jgi:hypothetical protein
MAEITIIEITTFENLIVEVPGEIISDEDLGIFDETFDDTFE